MSQLDLFREADFIWYRGKELRHPILSKPLLGKVLNQINLLLPMLTPQVFEINANPPGLENIPSSQWLFRINRSIETSLDSPNLHERHFRVTDKSIEKAASEK